MRNRYTHIPDSTITAKELAGSMEEYARYICGRKEIPPEAAIDAIDFAVEIKNAATDIPTDMIARLRAAAIRHRPQGYMMIATQMEMIADRLDYERKI